MAEFQRPSNVFRFEFGGVNTRDVPDALAPGKYAAAQNVRSTGAKSLRTRPGYAPVFATGNNNNGAPITDICTYTDLETDNLPRILARDANGNIWLGTTSNNNAGLAKLVGNFSGYSPGVTMLPFRPAESPQSWMYVASNNGYQKFQAPDSNNNVVAYKVGIAEPQQQVDASPTSGLAIVVAGNAGNWSNSGNAGTLSNANRTTDAFNGETFLDPVTSVRTYGPTNGGTYSAGELVFINNANAPTLVQEVFPGFSSNSTPITIKSISYTNNNSNTGPCVIALGQLPYDEAFIGTFQRGLVINLAGGGNNEHCLVLGVISGPSGQVAINTSTTLTFANNAVVTGITTLALDSNNGSTYPIATSVISAVISSNLTTGIGRISTTFPGGSPFAVQYQSGAYPQPDDYFHLSLSFSNAAALTQLLVMFTLDANNTNYAGDVYYYSVSPSDLVNVAAGGNNNSQLDAILQAAENQIISGLAEPPITGPAYAVPGNNTYSEIFFTLSQLTRLGSNDSRTLANCTGMMLQFEMAANSTVSFGSVWIGSGGQPDVGNGAPYKYCAVPMSSLTGVRGNPTALMQYGVHPRRQSVQLATANLNNSYDPQIDIWEVYRYGGAVTSYRFIGATPVGQNFLDNYTDDAALAGRLMEVDNTEPWPSIDLPLNMSNANSGIAVCGNQLQLSPFGQIAPFQILNWLPGTLFKIGNEAFTLRFRPTVIGPGPTYLFIFEECIGFGTFTNVSVLEPNVANQPQPYSWGPNEYGDFFSCGGQLRPGVISWSKPYAPDAAPTKNTLELCPPSEPLLGGAKVGGIDIVASSWRWWALYFQQGSPQRYRQVEIGVGKRLASTYGKCTDGGILYFWATDCIARTSGQAAAESLTDADLFNLFPHGGIAGKNVIRGAVTYYAPDYSQAARFRIAVREGIIYAFYVDYSGSYRALVGELRPEGVAWSTDTYADSMTGVFTLPQPRGTLISQNNTANFPAVLLGSNSGAVSRFQDLTNDGGNNAGGSPIISYVYTLEWDAGDARSNELWGDQYLDSYGPSGISVLPVTQGNPVVNVNGDNVPATLIPASTARQFSPISLGGGALLNFLGLQISWIDDFGTQTAPTTLHVWQPSFTEKPEIITNRFGDWVNLGAASYVRGCIIYANTFGVDKALAIRNADTGELVTFSGGPGPGIINHNGEQSIAYYFEPFVAHMVRDESQDNVRWQKFSIEWIRDPWAELTNLPSRWMNLGTTSAKFLQGLVIPLDTNGPVLLEGQPEKLFSFQPHRTIYIGGTNRTGAMGSLVNATENGFTIQTVFRDQADFCKLLLYDADDYFGHWQSTKFLPVFDLNGCVLSFDAAYTNLFPLESLKFPSIFQTYITVNYNDSTAADQFNMQPFITTAVGSLPAKVVYTVEASPAVNFDRVQLWYMNLNFDFNAVGGETAPEVAFSLASQINTINWVSLGPTMAIYAEAEGPNITVWAACWGTVNTDGALVTQLTGENFLTLNPGSPIQINGVVYRILAVASPVTLLLTSSAGSQTSVRYVAPGQGSDGNSIAMYALHKTSTLVINPTVTTHMTGGQACTSVSISLDFNLILGSTRASKVRQISMVFAPSLNYSAVATQPALLPYVSTECTAVFSNWNAANAPQLYISGPGTERSGSNDANYTGSWGQISGSYFNGFAQQTAGNNATVSASYNCGSTHDLYLGTALFTDCGIVTISVDGGNPVSIDTYILNGSTVITRRLITQGLASGPHSVVITNTGAKNAASSGFNFTFDYLEASVASNPTEIGYISLQRNAASDYDTQHGYQIAPARLYWLMRMVGLTGDWEHYIGAFFWQQRKRFGGTFSTATVTFSGTFSSGDGFGGGADSIFVTVGGTAMGKTVFPQDTLTTIAAHFVDFINSLFVGVHATSSAGVLTISLLSPINGFSFSTSFTPVMGSTGAVTPAGNLDPAAEGIWQLDPDTPGINIAATAWHRDMFSQLQDGQTMLVAFSQESSGSPDDPPTAVWRQRFNNNWPVETGTSLGTAGLGYITNVSGAGPYTVTMPGHGYLTGYSIVIFIGTTTAQRGQWTITRVDADNFTTVDVLVPSTAPQIGDTVVIQWQSDQLAFSNVVADYIGQAHLAIADLMAEYQLTPELEMGEILHWFFSYNRANINSLSNNNGVTQVNCAGPHGWSNNWQSIVPIFDANNNAVHPNEFTITVTSNNNFLLQGLAYNNTYTAGIQAFGGGMALYDVDQTNAANNALGRPLHQWYTSDGDPSVNNYADAYFLAERITAFQRRVQNFVFSAHPTAWYEMLWPEDVNRPVAPYFTAAYPFPQGGRLNAYVNLPESWKQQANSGFKYFKTEALSWSASYNAKPETVAAINYSTDVLNWTAEQSRYLIAWFNGNCYWPYEYSLAIAKNFNWVGFFAIDQLCLLSWQMPLSDAEVSGVNIEVISSDGDTILLPAVSTTADRKTAVPFSFDTPIIGHEFQIRPLQPLRYWPDEIIWHWQATPEVAKTWKTQWTALGSKGYKHIPRVEPAYASTAPVTLTIESFDGVSPVVINLPSTGGVMQRYLCTLTLNKGQLYRFSAYSSSPTMQIFLNDFVVHVCDWGRPGQEREERLVGAQFGDGATI